MTKSIVLIFLFFSSFLFADNIQNKKINIDSLRKKLVENPNLILKNIPTLTDYKLSNTQKINLYCVISDAYRDIGDFESMMDYVRKINYLLNTEKDQYLIVEMEIYSAARYIEINMLELANEKFKTILPLLKKLPEGNKKYYLKNYYYQNKTYLDGTRKDYESSIKNADSSAFYLSKCTDISSLEKKEGLMYIYFNQANSLKYLGDFTTLKNKLKLVKESNKDFKDQVIDTNINLLEGEIYIIDNKPKLAIQHISKAINYFEKHHDYPNLVWAYNLLERAYLSINNTNKLVEIKSRINELEKKITKNQNITIKKELGIIDQQKKDKQNQKYFLAAIILSTLLIVGGGIYLIKSRKKVEQKNVILKKSETSISDKFEKEILNKLDQFEKSNQYLKSNFTMAQLAAILETNTQYLSKLINSSKDKNFNVYINELRINYIIEKLKNHKEYRTYKISYLAEESGFPNHSSFTRAFKQIINQSPSDYIKELEQKEVN